MWGPLVSEPLHGMTVVPHELDLHRRLQQWEVAAASAWKLGRGGKIRSQSSVRQVNADVVLGLAARAPVTAVSSATVWASVLRRLRMQKANYFETSGDGTLNPEQCSPHVRQDPWTLRSRLLA